MRGTRALFFVAGSVLVVFLASTPARAVSPTRVFLGLNGNNANDCSNPATPCYSFAGALAQIATGGEVIIEATGGYGPLNITKSVSINAAAGVVAFSCCTVTVNAPGGVVVLRGLTIDGGGATGDGIDALNVSALYVESCVIRGFNGDGINFTSTSLLFVTDTIVRNNSLSAVYLAPASGTAQASVDHCRFENNSYGFESQSGAAATIRDSVLSGQITQGGIGAGALGGELNLESCLVANNPVGIVSAGGATVRVSNTTVTDNGIGVDEDGGSLLSRSNNTVEGNGINGTFTGIYGAK